MPSVISLTTLSWWGFIFGTKIPNPVNVEFESEGNAQ
jgi:hypothetical protein